MMMNPRNLMLVAAAALLAACGSRTALKPPQGAAPMPKAAAAKAPQTPEELMTPTSQARPDRTVDLLTQSVERQPDPFDTAPGSPPAPETDSGNSLEKTPDAGVE